MSPKPRKPMDDNEELLDSLTPEQKAFLSGENPPPPPKPPGEEGGGNASGAGNEDLPPKPPRKPAKQPKTKPQTSKPSLKDRLMEAEKEPTVRLTVDMPQSMHRKLSILCAQTGKKKADIVRMLLGEALDEVED